MALREQRPDGNAGTLTKSFLVGREGYHEAAAMRPGAVPDMGNVFNAMNGGNKEQALFMIAQEEAKAELSGGSSLNIAQAAASGSDTTRKERDKRREADTKLQMQVALLNAMKERIADLEDQLDGLHGNIDQANMMLDKINAGTFDPEGNAEEREFLQTILKEKGLSRTQWDDMTLAEQGDVITDYRDELIVKAEDLEDVIDLARDDLHAFEESGMDPGSLVANELNGSDERYKVVNGRFENSVLEEAAQTLEQESGEEFDRSNMTYGDLECLHTASIISATHITSGVLEADKQAQVNTQSTATIQQDYWLNARVGF